MFTCYEFTGGDKNSSIIYSDDNGATWHRGASMSAISSEAVMTEADGRVYYVCPQTECLLCIRG